METNADWSPYQGWSLAGFAETTFCRGRKIVDDYRFVGENGWGRWLPRERAGLDCRSMDGAPRGTHRTVTAAQDVESRCPEPVSGCSPRAIWQRTSPTCRRRWRPTRRWSRPRAASTASTPPAPGPARRTSTSPGSSARSSTATRSARPGRSSRPTSSAGAAPGPARPRSSARGPASTSMLMKAPDADRPAPAVRLRRRRRTGASGSSRPGPPTGQAGRRRSARARPA